MGNVTSGLIYLEVKNMVTALMMKIRRVTEIEAPGLGGKIKKIREQDPRSLVEICRLVGMTTSNWYRIEKDLPTYLNIETVQKIEEVLGVDLGVSFDD